MSRYRCVDAQKAAGFPVAAACKAAGVTRSASDAWTTHAAHPPSARHQEQARLVGEIRRIHARSKGTYGAHAAPSSSGGVAGPSTTSAWSGSCASTASSAPGPAGAAA